MTKPVEEEVGIRLRDGSRRTARLRVYKHVFLFFSLGILLVGLNLATYPQYQLFWIPLAFLALDVAIQWLRYRRVLRRKWDMSEMTRPGAPPEA